MKTCKLCSEEKPLEDFQPYYPSHKGRGGTVRPRCRECAASLRVAENAHHGGLRYARGRAIITAAKAVPCMDCGVSYPAHVMDLDHVRGEKVGNLSKMALKTPDTILAEIAKCDVVCANCHRERTQQRLA